MRFNFTWHVIFITLLCLFQHPSMSQDISDYPVYDKESIKVTEDWLVAEIEQKTGFFRTERNELVLSNGLISRIFALDRGGATMGLDNLMSGENMLRSVKPEAVVEIDHITLPVGGLLGQPIHNYLSEDWIPKLRKNPEALKLKDFSTGPTKARFPWKKRSEWMPQDLPWPAPGKQLTFSYVVDDSLLLTLVEKANSDAGRDHLFTDNFKTLGEHWTLKESPANDRNSFINEGKAGEIMAMANQAVYAYMKSPDQARVWLVKVDPGTDSGSSWGPGMALLTKAGKVYKLNARPGDGVFGIFDGERERKIGKLQESKAVWLRVEQKKSELSFSYAYEDGKYHTLLRLPKQASEVIELRVGKLSPDGAFKDHHHPGQRGRSRIESVDILGALDDSEKDRLLQDIRYLKDIVVNVHYEMYDGIPLMSKWITILNNSGQEIVVNSFKSEVLALTEPESAVDAKSDWLKPNITVETDYRFGGMSNDNLYSSSVAWNEDPLYKTQVNYELKTPVLLEAYPKLGPEKTLQPGEAMESFRIWELFHDSWNRERKGLAQRKMYRSQAPWVTENPIMMHVRNADNASVKKAIDQCAETGFEMVIMTFGSGFDIEDNSEANLNRMEALADYAHKKGVALGGYSLLASRSIDAENDVVMPEGKTPRFGNSPCLESAWGNAYFDKLYNFYQKTGHDLLEHDGSYPGDVCISENHPGHKGLADSQWNQFEKIKSFYEWCRSQGIYLNVPDHYFMAGSNKTGMGYRETNWSLPRAYQEIIERQNVYDGTWEKTPSMGWMFVPLVEYHGGGKAATIEPLKDHLPHYEQRLANLFGAGVQACYRGPQLYDSPETKAIVIKWVNFYKKYREVLDSDLVHIRRPDGRDYDGVLHVNPHGKNKGLIMLYNPLDQPIVKSIPVNLYYTGLTRSAIVTNQQGEAKEFHLKRDYTIELPVNIPARSQQWFLVN